LGIFGSYAREDFNEKSDIDILVDFKRKASFMSERNLTLMLLDIKVSIGRILEYTAGTTFDSYEADYKTKDAVERNFEIIGEAASRIPDDFKKLHPNVEL
jgi:predicted nucleotidyltransferase